MKRKIILILAVCTVFTAQLPVLNTAAQKQTTTAVSSASEESISDKIDNLESIKSGNSDKINELQKEIDEAEKKLQKSKDDEQAKLTYQNAVEEKIVLQQENILYIEKQINALEDDISERQNNIAILESEIAQKEQEVEQGKEDFRARLRAMYISGNETYASILTGSTSFYDLLSRIELISRISKRDDEFISGLQEQVISLNEDKAALENENILLEQQVESANIKKSEHADVLQSLSNDYQATQEEIDEIALEQQKIELSQSEMEKQLSEMEEEQKKIDDEIAAAQAEIRRIQEEEERKRKEEEERLRKEEEERKRQEELKRQEEEKKKQEALSSNSEPVVTAPPETNPPAETTTPAVTLPPVNDNIYTGGKMTWPVPGHYIITDYYGKRTWDGSGFHYGLDLGGGNIGGSSIVAAESGTVILAVNYCTHNYAKYSSCGCGGGFGNYVVIDHGGTYATLYGHCESVSVSVGDKVTKGQTIGKVGTTGYSTGFHLHFEVRKNGERVNPLDYLSY
ncbi:MAG: murein hydrolase activator EnvC family protein [Oscillospiraceae bacterium]